MVLGFRVDSGDLREKVVVTVGCFMLAILAAEIVYVGLASYANTGDDDREWLARAAGWLFASALVWMSLAVIVLCAGAIAGLYGTLVALGASLLSGGATAAAGSSAKTAANLAFNVTTRLGPLADLGCSPSARCCSSPRWRSFSPCWTRGCWPGSRRDHRIFPCCRPDRPSMRRATWHLLWLWLYSQRALRLRSTSTAFHCTASTAIG